ncbi:MAG TPA: RloB family protein [Bryobacteraceae bacterium]|nr:RloB family protein [Bryobacteraceae bacterium]
MSLIQRKPRPLTRDAAQLRDDRLFIVACDDYAPKQYFELFKIPRVQIHVVPTEDGTSAALHVLSRLAGIDHEEDDELWMLLDTDHCTKGTHISSFLSAISEAKRKGVRVALSKPCFELWLLLHHVAESEVGSLSSAADVDAALRVALGQYNKTRISAGHFPIQSVSDACRRAETLDGTVPGGDIPTGNTSRVYQLWKAIVAKALPSQLPAELKHLAP